MRNIFNTSVEAIDGAINVEPTSSKTANASPFNLRQPTDFTRFYFKPILVNNSKEPSNSVKGKLIYEKKGKKDSFFRFLVLQELSPRKALETVILLNCLLAQGKQWLCTRGFGSCTVPMRIWATSPLTVRPLCQSIEQ